MVTKVVKVTLVVITVADGGDVPTINSLQEPYVSRLAHKAPRFISLVTVGLGHSNHPKDSYGNEGNSTFLRLSFAFPWLSLFFAFSSTEPFLRLALPLLISSEPESGSLVYYINRGGRMGWNVCEWKAVPSPYIKMQSTAYGMKIVLLPLFSDSPLPSGPDWLLNGVD